MSFPLTLGAFAFFLSLVLLAAALATARRRINPADSILVALGIAVGTAHYVFPLSDRAIQVTSLTSLALVGTALARRVTRAIAVRRPGP